jgi:hypothetical protein
MRDRIVVIDIDTKNYKVVSYKQFDENNVLQIVAIKDGKKIEIEDCSALIHFQLPSGITYNIQGSIENNIIKVILTSEILNEHGRVTAKVKLTRDEQIFTVFFVYLNVEENINIMKSLIVNNDVEEGECHYHENKDVLDQITQELIDKIGNIDKNTEDITKILNIIDEPPTYTSPTLSLSSSKSNVEHNKTTDITLTPTFKQNDAGNVIYYELLRNNSSIFGGTNVISYTDSITLTHGNSITYKATVTYADGVIKNTLLGIAYPDTSIKEGSISSNTTIRAYALSCYGVINSDKIENTNGLTSVLRTGKGST